MSVEAGEALSGERVLVAETVRVPLTSLMEAMRALAIPMRLLGRREVPAWRSVRVAVTGEGLDLAATDGDTTVLARVAGEPAGQSFPVVLVEYDCLAAAVKAFGHVVTGAAARRRHLVAVQVSGGVGRGSVVLSDGARRFAPTVRDLGDCPSMVSVPPVPTATMPAVAFKDAVARVVKSADKGDTLPILTGVRARVGSGRLVMVATDRYRLAEIAAEVASGPAGEVEFVAPANVLAPAARVLRGEDVALTVHDLTACGTVRAVTVSDGSVDVTTRLLEGTYPKIDAVWAARHTVRVAVDRATLLATVKSVAALLERHEPVRLDVAGGEIAVHGPDDAGRQSVPVLESTGLRGAMLLGYNPVFLMDALASLNGEVVTVHLNGNARPATLTEHGQPATHPDRVALMPVRFPAEQ